MSWITKTWKPEEVCDAESFADYVQQELGTPYPNLKQLILLRTAIRKYFEANEKANWQTLTKIVQFAKSRKKHPSLPHAVLQEARFAWAAGWLPELMPSERTDVSVEDGIEEALSQETNQEWRRLLLGCRGTARAEILSKWRRQRQSVLA